MILLTVVSIALLRDKRAVGHSAVAPLVPYRISGHNVFIVGKVTRSPGV